MRIAILLLLLSPAALVAAGRAHQHGVAQLDVAVERATIEIRLESPLDALVGFERAPRTGAERRRVDDAVATLKAGDKLFRIDPAAQCRLDRVEVESPVLALGMPASAPAADGHADLTAVYGFTCADATRAGHVEVGLFAAFDRLQRLNVQVAGTKVQSKHTLRRADPRLPLSRRER